MVWKLLGGEPKFYTDTHTHTHTHTHTQTHTHTHTHTHTPRSILLVLFFCENAETRLTKRDVCPLVLAARLMEHEVQSTVDCMSVFGFHLAVLFPSI